MMILPEPSDTFAWTETPSGPALLCRPLEPFATHIFTSRLWPLGTSSDRDAEESWRDIAHALGADGPRLLRARQVHGAAVVAHREGHPIGPRADADILLSSDPRVAPAVQTADCVPILIADSRTGAVAAAHAGWRGMAARVPLVTVEALVAEFGVRESKLIAAVGPSIGACCYEVGGDVRDRFAAAGFNEWELARWFTAEPRSSPTNPSMPGLNRRARDNHWFLDMWTAARDQLRSAGVREDRIFVADLCTASHPDAFCSYRRDRSRGRMAAAIQKGGSHQ
jgi:YfiH family protein